MSSAGPASQLKPFRLAVVAAILGAMALLTACTEGGSSTTSPSASTEVSNPTGSASTVVAVPDSSGDPQIETILAAMPPEDKVGQMLMFGFEGTVANDSWRPLVVEDRVGGLVLLSSNIAGPGELAAFSREVQSASAQEKLPFGILLAINQEGGNVLGLQGAFTQFPSAATVGKAASAGLARELGVAIGEEMRVEGLNMDLAPVLDVEGDPPSPPIVSRSFGSDPELVAQMGVAFIRGLQDAGIIATAKHFPGHGSAPADSHVQLPVDGRDEVILRTTDISPFEAAIRAGVDAIMTAHVSYPVLDDQIVLPATLSPRIVTDLLRDELGFDGVVVTDSLTMGAITNTLPASQAAVDAVLAGADVILVPGTADVQDQVRQALLDAVADGRISMERLNQSVKRILRMKKQYNVGELQAYDPSVISGDQHQKVVEAIIAEAASAP